MARRKDEKIELLRGIRLFEGCTAKELDRIGGLLTEVKADAGETLMTEGQPGLETYVIAEGEAVVSIGGRKRATVGPGEIVGEMSLLDHQPRAATVTAKTAMRLYLMDPREFSSVLNDVPQVAVKILRTLAQRLREAERNPAL